MTSTRFIRHLRSLSFFVFISALIIFGSAYSSIALAGDSAVLYMVPAGGDFTVGSTFAVSFYVDTSDQFINVVDTKILFPPDKLQVVSPSTGSSFINVWAIQPSYSNTDGTISFRGAVPNPGVNTSAGLISTVTFRVKSIGSAAIRFSNDSKVLLNDGLGTDILGSSRSGIYTLTLPPPAGPLVSSKTHPNQLRWYGSGTVDLHWKGESATGYSHMLNNDPTSNPDNISEGPNTSAIYEKLSSGRYYFHVKALRDGVWGGVTHYAVNVDTAPPADFPVVVSPGARTAQHQPVLTFLTTDGESGLDHYEMKLIPLVDGTASAGQTPIYTEVSSPFLPQYLDFGRYDVYVRAYDSAGNYQEVLRRLEIIPTFFEIIQGQGIEIRNVFFIPWSAFWSIGMLILLILGITATKLHLWHRGIDILHRQGKLSDDINGKLIQLKEYQDKYGKVAVIFGLLIIITLSLGISSPVMAAQLERFSPPVITTVSKDIFSDEIFYVGGRTATPEATIILYMQRLSGGETTSRSVAADINGDWFYRNSDFLEPGGYLVWAQTQRGEEMSPPSPQITMSVASHAIQLGTSRFSYEAIYFAAMVLLGLMVLILAGAIWYHYHNGKRKYRAYQAEKQKIEEVIRRGFALLRRDIEGEAKLLHHTKRGRELNQQEAEREKQILKDLAVVKQHIGKELWELEKLEDGAKV